MSWRACVSAQEVRGKGLVAVEVEGLRLALFALDGEFFATSNICTHAFALLSEGRIENGCVECPLHQGLFDIRTGRAQGAPVSRDLATYRVKVEDGVVWIDTEAKAVAASPAPARDRSEAQDLRRLVIVGAGQAGAELARAARAHGFAGNVVLIGEEDHPPYERPPLSKDMLLGRKSLAEAYVFQPGEIEDLRLDLRLKTRVAAIDRQERRVALGSGEALAYDMLALATGASARRLTLPGAETGKLHYLRDVADSEALGRALKRARRVAVIGGGFIGLELASAARALGAGVALIETQERLLTRLLPAEASEFLAWVVEQNDVELRLGQSVRGVSAEGVTLADGAFVAADCIVVGVGAAPNDQLAVAAGLECAAGGGVLVNARGQTSDPAIYAIGDAAVRRDEITGRERRLESWENARLSADRAARALAGAPQAQADPPWFWSDLFGGTLQVVGHPSGELDVVRRDGEGPAFFCLDKTGRVVACVDFDGAALALARRLIASGRPVNAAALADPRNAFSEIEEGEMRMLPIEKRFAWPASGLDRVPDWVYTSREIYDREIERIFHGATWNYVALDAEIPNAGDFVRSNVGPTSVVVVRDGDGSINVFENRCSHRAAEFCRELRGNNAEFVCPYHQWSYDLKGDLAGVPFRRGVNGEGGMGPEFRPESHGLRKLRVAQRNGAVFASFSEDVEPLEDYLGEEMLRDFDAVFSGRKLRVLGHYRHTLLGNWKLYPENLKDPYHATLLHTFLVTFGLLVAGNKSAMIVDPRGRHSTMASAKSDGASVSAENKAQMRAYRDGMTLSDPRLMQFFPEFDSPWSVTMQVIWPGLIVQREMNTLGVRQIIPNGPNEFTMVWTMFGYEDDDDEMTRHRLRQGNLMGPAGFLGLEDNEAMKFVQDGMLRSTGGEHVVALDPKVPAGTSTTLISEAAIRAMYKHWRQEMGL